MPIAHHSRKHERPVIRLQRLIRHLEPPSPIMQTSTTSYLKTSSLDRNPVRHDSFYKAMNRAESLDSIDIPTFKPQVISLGRKTRSCDENLMMHADVQQRNQNFPRQLSKASNTDSTALPLEEPLPTDNHSIVCCNFWVTSNNVSVRIATTAVAVAAVSVVAIGIGFIIAQTYPN